MQMKTKRTLAAAGVCLPLVVVGLALAGGPDPSASSDVPLAVYTHQLTAFTAGMFAATILLAGATLALWWTTHDTLTHLGREFVATHRPRLVVRRVRIENGDD